ncbi:MAG: N-acetylmuramoyl-L-alanine amidase, partial [Nitrospinae bacterium]|nr:N-acetylmuramoyl-L-alanine amidase [Nitrospinota bacterium]
AVKVALTASPEKNTDQRERAYIANSNKGKLFISLHAASGFAQKPHAMGIYVPEIADVKTPTWKEAGKRHIAKSVMFAERLKAALDAAFPGNQYFLGKGPLALFHGVAMPAVAVEAVDMSQPPTPETIAKFAEAVYSALAELDGRL